MDYKIFTANNYRQISQSDKIKPEHLRNIDIVSKVLPFKTNNYVVDELIDWDNYEEDPLFILNFPQGEMLQEDHYMRMAPLVDKDADSAIIKEEADKIRHQLNPHPAGQSYNVPVINGTKLSGAQHKYDETILFFPSQGQTCHAYCTFCFRWPQFTGMSGLKFGMRETDYLIEYIREHPEITDLLFTGGDPLIMRANILDAYISRILEADLPNLQTIRIGTKALSFWPYRFLTDPDSADLLKLFEKITSSGKNLAYMAHFNHPRELSTETVKRAVKKIINTGAQIRTQSPLLNHINADSRIWSDLWINQVAMGMVPYYMFIARNTGAQQYFGVTLAKAWEIFRNAYNKISGIARTVRGPSMSCFPGKIKINGVTELNGDKVFVMEFIQGRSREWVKKPFFAEYNPDAAWIDDLKPAFGKDQFFYQEELNKLINR